MSTVVSIGNQDFGSIRKSESFHIDKTVFIAMAWPSRGKKF